MTIVVTTASQYGITVVGDKAQTSIRGETREVHNDARKVYYSAAANVSLAFWGDARMPHGSLETWAATFVDSLCAEDSVKAVALRLETELSAVLEPLSRRGWWPVRRGAHVAGFIDGLPYIYHVHTGDPRHGEHAPKVHPEYPTVQMSTGDHRQHLADGYCAQLRNGEFDLFGDTFDWLREYRIERERMGGIAPPSRDLRMHLAMDAAAVQLASKILAANGSPPSVSEEIDCLAFTASGLVSDAVDPTAGGAFKLLIAEACESLRQSMRISFNRVENQGTMTSSLIYGPLAWPDTNKGDAD
jgi:hypothetical protein